MSHNPYQPIPKCILHIMRHWTLDKVKVTHRNWMNALRLCDVMCMVFSVCLLLRAHWVSLFSPRIRGNTLCELPSSNTYDSVCNYFFVCVVFFSFAAFRLQYFFVVATLHRFWPNDGENRMKNWWQLSTKVRYLTGGKWHKKATFNSESKIEHPTTTNLYVLYAKWMRRVCCKWRCPWCEMQSWFYYIAVCSKIICIDCFSFFKYTIIYT